jgi:hypothetical protein
VKLNHLRAAVACLVLGCLPLCSAIADSVLFDGSGFVEGTQSFAQMFNLTGPGTLTVTLSNVAFPQPLANLDFLLSSANGAMGPEMNSGTGTYSFAIAAGGNVFAQWFGTAQGPLNAGVYSLNIDFVPSGSTVPLPASVFLLLSGLLLVWLARRRMLPATLGRI